MMNEAPRSQFDFIVAACGFLLSTILVVYLAMTIGRAVYVLTASLAAISCIVWILIRNRVKIEKLDFKPNQRIGLVLICAFLLLFILMVMTIQMRSQQYERPIGYFIIVSGMAGVVAAEVVLLRQGTLSNVAILLQIIIIGVSVVYSQLVVFPSVVGVDPWWHQMFTLKIIDLGHLPDGYSYSRLPVFHLEVATTSLVVSTDYKTSTMLSISIAQIVLTTLAVFIIARTIVGERVGLLASLILAISSAEVHMGFWTIPTTIGVVMIPLILVCLFRFKVVGRTGFVILGLVLMGTIILTHPLAAAMMATLMLVGGVISRWRQVAVRDPIGKPFDNVVLALFVTGMLGWWTYATGNLETLANLIAGGFNMNAFISAPRPVLDYVNSVPVSQQILDNLGVIVSFSMSFVGCFFMISRWNVNWKAAVVAVFGIVSLALPFLSLVTNANIFNDRWWYTAQIFLSIPLATTLIIATGTIRQKRLKPIVVITALFIISFLMLISSTSNIDNDSLTQRLTVRTALTESELVSVYETQSLFGETVSTDRYYAYAILYLGYDGVPFDDRIFNRDFESSNRSLILIRSEILTAPFYLYTSVPWMMDYNPEDLFDGDFFPRVFDCGTVSGYVTIP